MKQPSTGSRLLQGAFILGLAAIISKIIGAFQKIPLQNLGGDGVFGIYNTVYPLYMLIITLAAAGLPLAVSKFVAEQNALGRPDESRRIIRLSSLLLGGIGIIMALLMYAGAPLIADMIRQPPCSSIDSCSFMGVIVRTGDDRAARIFSGITADGPNSGITSGGADDTCHRHDCSASVVDETGRFA